MARRLRGADPHDRLSGSRFGVDRLLASRPLVYIGGISYGLYLWHWPVGVLSVAYRFRGRRAGRWTREMTAPLAAVSTQFVENPLRFSGITLPRHDVAAFVAAWVTPRS